ncbi:acyl-CoA dehydrogenase family protein [Kordiimonas aestuarii]|uniref:acyl-CoA dehydrogenase family protein n=1 Tax=Kordiimonas aestuarii TaxID=1005925 RepID=UPI0021CE3EF6|nr:acyl-CoA dehydrogenase family protein [Kordiimonas aestuarii]
MTTAFETHQVFNQPPAYDGVDLYRSDLPLVAALLGEGADWATSELSAFGTTLGTEYQFHQGHLANKFLPELNTFDQQGFRADRVDFHPAYHHFMVLSKEAGIHCGAFDRLATDDRRKHHGVGPVRAAKHYMMSQVEAGHICPITMTHAAIPALMNQPDLFESLKDKLLSRSYDRRFIPIAEKTGITVGMGMTEKQGGTDVRANTTTAKPLKRGGAGKRYLITGHKWFMSAPMCDAFLVLAQTDERLSVFYVPRFREDGSVNGLKFQRLKNKLGNKSNASSEVEFHEAEGVMIGDEGRGIANIMTMANYTRLDCALGSAGLMRQALSRAVHHARHRTVFQRKLIDQPMMTALLADMSLEVTAATHLSLRLAGSYERAAENDEDSAYARLMTPVTKYWVTKRGPTLAYEAMEIHGGNGYVEDGVLARIYRELPVNSIWEGSGSVMCLDLMRVAARERDAFEAGIRWLGGGMGHAPTFDSAYKELATLLSRGSFPESQGRWLTERIATLAAARLLMERAPDHVAHAYIATRLDGNGRHGAYGSLPDFVDSRLIIEETVSLDHS